MSGAVSVFIAPARARIEEATGRSGRTPTVCPSPIRQALAHPTRSRDFHQKETRCQAGRRS